MLQMEEERKIPDTQEPEKAPQTPQSPEENGGFRQSLWEFVKFFLIAVLIVVPIRVWVAQPFIVSGSSMIPNYENGQYLIVDEFSYHFREPARGEVIIFRAPPDPSEFYIKRIIGLPGETVQISNGQITIFNSQFPNGTVLKESYLPNDYTGSNLSVNLSPDEYFVLGDNRPMSSDSRVWGPLKANLIVGRAWLRLWPINKAAILF